MLFQLPGCPHEAVQLVLQPQPSSYHLQSAEDKQKFQNQVIYLSSEKLIYLNYLYLPR